MLCVYWVFASCCKEISNTFFWKHILWLVQHSTFDSRMCLSCKLNQELEWKFESVIRVQCMQGKCLKVLFIYRMYYHSWLCWSRSTDGSLYVGWWKVCCFQNLFIALFCLVHSVSTQYLVRNRTGFLLELCFVSDVFLFHTSGFNLISGVSNHNQHKLLLGSY